MARRGRVPGSARRAARGGESAARKRPRPSRQAYSSRAAAPPATRTTSATSTTRRVPSAPRAWQTTRSKASATCSRSAACGRPRPAISASVSMRRRASAALPAWTVESEPSWPVDSAVSRSSASPPRTSPTMIRSGRIRSALRTSRRIVTSPRPSRLGGRASSRITCGWRSDSSAASSIVTTRSPSAMNEDSALSVVVLPEPVPPHTSTVQRARTARPRKSSTARLQRAVLDQLARA